MLNVQVTHATREVTVISEVVPFEWTTATDRQMRVARFWTEWVETDGNWHFRRASVGGVLLHDDGLPTRTPAWDAWTLPPNTDPTRSRLVTELPDEFADIARDHYREAAK